jgi:hypothetical protein
METGVERGRRFGRRALAAVATIGALVGKISPLWGSPAFTVRPAPQPVRTAPPSAAPRR